MKRNAQQVATAEKRAEFLAAYRKSLTITQAAEAVGVDRSDHYRWLADEGYRKQFEDSQEEVIQALEDVAVARATRGLSDVLLIFLLKGHRPAKYRDTYRAEISAPGGQPLVPTRIEVVCVPPPAEGIG